MKLKNENGFTGVDIAVAVVVIFIFVSIIAVLFYNFNSSTQEIERKSQATYYAIAEIEKIKNNGFSEYADKNKNIGNIEEEYVKDENGKETSYYKTVLVEDYTDLEGNESKLPNLLKKVTVTITYKFKAENKEVSLSTILSKEN